MPGRVLFTFSARARSSVWPLVSAAEGLLHDRGWRTRVPPRRGRAELDAEQRRRLREDAYRAVEAAAAVAHVPGGQGDRLPRELSHALRSGRPIYVLACLPDRERLGVPCPPPDLLASLQERTEALLVPELDRLVELLPGPAA